MNISPEYLQDCLGELKVHFQAHKDELALYADKGVTLNPMYERYLLKERLGETICMVGREAGEVVAYYVGFIGPWLHYQDQMSCHTDIWYVAPRLRNGLAGVKLLKATEKELKRRGVTVWFLGGKIARRGGDVAECGRELREVRTDPSALFERLGAERVEITYSKWLG